MKTKAEQRFVIEELAVHRSPMSETEVIEFGLECCRYALEEAGDHSEIRNDPLAVLGLLIERFGGGA